MANIICGVDVSSKGLDASIGREGPALKVARTAQGVAELARFCRAHGVELLVMEATGGYEKLPFALLWQEAIPCALANPRSVRRFAEAMGVLEKTDRIDAGLIAAFAAAKGFVPQPPPAKEQERLRAFADRLRQITQALVVQKNQRRLVVEKAVLASIDEVIALLKRQARDFERRIEALIEADPAWQALAAAFRSIKGVAGRSTARLLASLPEIGTLSGKAVAKLAGLAPIARDSGTLHGKRRVRGGREPIRSILFVVAEIVRRHEPDFAAFHHKLKAAGKPKLLIRVALARKLLVRLNAKARDARRQIQCHS